MRVAIVVLLLGAIPAVADEEAVKKALKKEIIGKRLTLTELQDQLEPQIPKLPEFTTAQGWTRYADKLRADILTKVVLRGKAAEWSKAKLKVHQEKDVIKGVGYTITKLRYEAVPGLWIPALLYVPDKVTGKVPVYMAVNGHDRKGKAATYKQIRCINLVKRGIIVLNVEWFGMGQLNVPGNAHGAMNQLDLCGTSGLAPFYLSMKRGIDVLLSHKNADPKRVGVSGLSGGGWQTIVISSLDTRVTLSNPVAGYSSFRVRIRDHFKDLGDSEQTPTDLATLADYTHLTALRAPRPTLLTYNAKDNCCFEAGYALPPLLKAAGPLFKLLGNEKALRSHINHIPGDHNYGKENREAFYKIVGGYFFPDDKKFSSKEIDCTKEIQKADELQVELPRDNATFNTLARDLAKELPLGEKKTETKADAVKWQRAKEKLLAERVRVPRRSGVKATQVSKTTEKGTTATLWKLKQGTRWTIPVVEFERGKSKGTTILINDAGRAADFENVERLLKAGQRVLAVDLFYFGEARLMHHDWLFALLVSAVGDRPLGIQATQLNAVAHWAVGRHKSKSVDVVAVGPRLSLVALVAAGLESVEIGNLELHGCRASLRELIAENRTVNQMPEMFCFGLLEVCDIAHLVRLFAPRKVLFKEGKETHTKELSGLKDWYKLFGVAHDPLK